MFLWKAMMNHSAARLLSFLAMALFLRAALFLWISPLVAARSTVLTAVLNALSLLSRSPELAASSNFLILVFISDLADLFLAAAFCESRTLLAEDLIFGIRLLTPPFENNRKAILSPNGAKRKSFVFMLLLICAEQVFCKRAI